MASKPEVFGTSGMKARPWWRAVSQGATCLLPWRCPVYRWRELVAGAGMEQENCRLDTGGQARPMTVSVWSREGGSQAVTTASCRVPMRGTGADRPVVVTKAR